MAVSVRFVRRGTAVGIPPRAGKPRAGCCHRAGDMVMRKEVWGSRGSSVGGWGAPCPPGASHLVSTEASSPLSRAGCDRDVGGAAEALGVHTSHVEGSRLCG